MIAPRRKQKETEVIGNTLILHGHKIPKIDKKIKQIIIGHEHPAVSLDDGIKKEIFKCFLKGSYKNRELIVLPSFNLINEGSDVLNEDFLSPFLKNADIETFKVFIASPEKTYDFGNLERNPQD